MNKHLLHVLEYLEEVDNLSAISLQSSSCFDLVSLTETTLKRHSQRTALSYITFIAVRQPLRS